LSKPQAYQPDELIDTMRYNLMHNQHFRNLLLSIAGYMLLWLVVPYAASLKEPKTALPLMLALTAAFMFAQLSITRWLTSLTMRPLASAALIIIALTLWCGAVYTVSLPYAFYETKEAGIVPVLIKHSPPPKTAKLTTFTVKTDKLGNTHLERVKTTGKLKQSSWNLRLAAFDLRAGYTRALTSLLMILAASAFGYLVSFILRHPNIVLPIAIFAPFIDIWTVFIGPTAHALKSHPHVVRSVSAAIPAVGSASTGFAPISFIGPADFIFLAIFLGAMYRHKMEPTKTFWALYPILTIIMAAVIAGPYLSKFGLPALSKFPALVPMGIVAAAANHRHFKLARDEWKAVIIVGLILIAALAAAVSVMR